MIKKLIITAIILFLTIMLVTALHEINKHDLSVQKAATCNLKEKGPIYLITYGDGDAYIANTKVLAESALNNCVDVVYMYRREHLDEDFVAKNEKILDAKRGAGYMLWKPYVTLKTLEQVPENSIVIYMDAGLKIIHPLDNFINNIVGYDMLLVDNPPHLNKQYVKRDLFKIMNMDNEKDRDTAQVGSEMYVIRNNVHSREFVKKWLDIGQIEGAITDDLSKDEYPEFVAHRHDQSILSLLYVQNHHGIKIFDMYAMLNDVYWHRRRNTTESLFLLDHSVKDFEWVRIVANRLPLLEKWLYKMLMKERKLDALVHDF